MPPSSNKEKVLSTALALFNRDGLVNVRLQHISDAAVVSLGNMAYHFKNKDAIVQALWETLVERQLVLLQEFRVLPLFEDMERLLRSMFLLQQEYRFFYLDMLEIMRAYPEIGASYAGHLSWQISQMETMLQFNVSRGAFNPEPVQGFWTQVASLFWMTADLWMYRQYIAKHPPDDFLAFRKNLWALFLPLCTDMGRQEFFQVEALFLEKKT